jgi:hypothetical protein
MIVRLAVSKMESQRCMSYEHEWERMIGQSAVSEMDSQRRMSYQHGWEKMIRLLHACIGLVLVGPFGDVVSRNRRKIN